MCEPSYSHQKDICFDCSCHNMQPKSGTNWTENDNHAICVCHTVLGTMDKLLTNTSKLIAGDRKDHRAVQEVGQGHQCSNSVSNKPLTQMHIDYSVYIQILTEAQSVASNFCSRSALHL